MEMFFYHCFTESAHSFSFIWCCIKRLQGIVRVCGKIAGIALNDLSDLHKIGPVKKTPLIQSDPSHTLEQWVHVAPIRLQIHSAKIQDKPNKKTHLSLLFLAFQMIVLCSIMTLFYSCFYCYDVGMYGSVFMCCSAGCTTNCPSGTIKILSALNYTVSQRVVKVPHNNGWKTLF